jgi:hypothetical protein
MSDYNHRNQAFDYSPPVRSGSGAGALLFIGGIVLLFILAMVFMGPGPEAAGDGVVPADGAAPAVAPLEETAPAGAADTTPSQ